MDHTDSPYRLTETNLKLLSISTNRCFQRKTPRRCLLIRPRCRVH